MADIATTWIPLLGAGDWALAGGDLASGSDLETAVLISLFTDAQAAPDDVIPDGTSDPRGWWGDDGETTPIGSKIWLLARSKATPDIPSRLRTAILSALQWLVDDKVVTAIDAQVTLVGGQAQAVVTLTRSAGQAQVYSYLLNPPAAAAPPASSLGALDFSDTTQSAEIVNL